MKRYIRASFSDSMPDWLKSRLQGKEYRNVVLRNKVLDKYGIAIDRANFSKTKTDNSIPIYLIDGSWGAAVYIPGVNDDDVTVRVNGRDRKIKNVAQSRIPDYVKDAVYVDLKDSANTFDKKKERYQDPRYSYTRNDQRGSYAGQYKNREYIGDGKYSEEYTWSETGRRPSNESRSRDKSGYKIPSPESRIKDFYTRFPEKLTAKVEQVYMQILETRDRLAEVDFKSPLRYGGTRFNNAYHYLGDAIDNYRQLLYEVDELSSEKHQGRYRDSEWYISSISGRIATIKSRLKDAEQTINDTRYEN